LTSVCELVRVRAAHRCEYCQLPQAAVPWAQFHIEHVRARQHGGTDEASNLALARRRCNAYKGPNLTAIDPVTGGIVPLFNPRADNWGQHFAVRGYLIEGESETGRATAALLNMNDPDRMQLRAEIDFDR
jgi:hypothetical protein